MSECTHDCSSCGESCASREPQSLLKAHHADAHVGKVYGIVSGKGGVGKSMVTSQLAVTMRRRGYQVGILDADITGPSIPKAFGIHDRAMGTENALIPSESKTGIQVMSINLLLENETDPVIWRGPVISGVVQQFWTDVLWNCDYLFVDMPPGTGDVSLSVFQSIPLDGIIIVASMVTSQLAVTMRRRGYQVGILDADITGPSIPKAFGIHDRAMGTENALIPSESKTGIQVMSINLLLENETDPVIWRGPVISGVVQQFWTDVLWNCDYLFVDMPPGTGDVSLSVFQSIPLDGIIIVASPQDLVGMVVEKAVKMAEMMNVPIVGLVENMSYVACPDCGKKIYLFGEGKTAQAAAAHNLPLLAEMPIDPALASLTDAGSIEDFQGDWLKTVADRLAEK